MRRLKEALDPAGILNPGVILTAESVASDADRNPSRAAGVSSSLLPWEDDP